MDNYPSALTGNIFVNRNDELANVPHRITELNVRFSSEENLEQFIRELELEYNEINYSTSEDTANGYYNIEVVWIEENHIAIEQLKKIYGLAACIETTMLLNAHYAFKDPSGEAASFGGFYLSVNGEYSHSLEHFEFNEKKVAEFLDKYEIVEEEEEEDDPNWTPPTYVGNR